MNLNSWWNDSVYVLYSVGTSYEDTYTYRLFIYSDSNYYGK